MKESPLFCFSSLFLVSLSLPFSPLFVSSAPSFFFCNFVPVKTFTIEKMNPYSLCFSLLSLTACLSCVFFFLYSFLFPLFYLRLLFFFSFSPLFCYFSALFFSGFLLFLCSFSLHFSPPSPLGQQPRLLYSLYTALFRKQILH